ncbi:hypothetical protein TNCV_434821 [Trichonephila clavipes]|nr:hypothetical protein TNCV_434821 [Trichonephila clavipes]
MNETTRLNRRKELSSAGGTKRLNSAGENNSTRQHERNNSTQQEKTTQLDRRNKRTQLYRRNETTQLGWRKQLSSASGMEQLDSATPATACTAFTAESAFLIYSRRSNGSVTYFHTTGPSSINGLLKVDSAFYHRCSGSINESQACLGSETLEVSLQTDHLIGTSAQAPQHSMVTYTVMGILGPGPHV